MKIKLDENLPQALAIYLNSCGVDAHTVAQEGLIGAADANLLDAACSEQRVLFTFDTDFADIRRYPPSSHAGVVVFRLRDQRWAALEPHVKALVGVGKLNDLAKCLAIVDEDRVRLRH